MGFAGLSDDTEGPGAVSAYKATSVEPIIGKRFVRCKKFFDLFTTIRFQISTGKNSFYINRLIIHLAPSCASSRSLFCRTGRALPCLGLPFLPILMHGSKNRAKKSPKPCGFGLIHQRRRVEETPVDGLCGAIRRCRGA